MNDNLSDMLTRIRNAYRASKVEVSLPHTNYLEKIAKVLVAEKYLTGSSVVKDDKGRSNLILKLAYAGHSPAVTTVRRVSKPGVRIYLRNQKLRPVLSGLGIAVLSTSQGIMTDRSAKKAKLGGEVLFELW